MVKINNKKSPAAWRGMKIILFFFSELLPAHQNRLSQKDGRIGSKENADNKHEDEIFN
jgi:hypothetical protein